MHSVTDRQTVCQLHVEAHFMLVHRMSFYLCCIKSYLSIDLVIGCSRFRSKCRHHFPRRTKNAQFKKYLSHINKCIVFRIKSKVINTCGRRRLDGAFFCFAVNRVTLLSFRAVSYHTNYTELRCLWAHSILSFKSTSNQFGV